VQTAGEALNFHPHLHGCLADGVFSSDGTFTQYKVVDLAALTSKFGEAVLAALAKRELLTDNDVVQILSQTHTGFNVWLGESFQDEQSEKFVARLVPHSFSDGGYIERGPISLEKLTIQDDILWNQTLR